MHLNLSGGVSHGPQETAWVLSPEFHIIIAKQSSAHLSSPAGTRSCKKLVFSQPLEHPGPREMEVLILIWNWQSLWVICDTYEGFRYTFLVLYMIWQYVFFLWNLNKNWATYIEHKVLIECHYNSLRTQTLRWILFLYKSYEILYADHQLSHQVYQLLLFIQRL